jgi:hypothetical protein
MSGDEDDQTRNLVVDDGGRTVLEAGRCFDHSTRVWNSVISPHEAKIDQLVDDCRRAYLKVKTTTRGQGIPYETNATYWIGAGEEPSTALEQFVLDIFRFHVRGHDGTFDVARSGAEWWTQVVDSERDIGFHWDRDYEVQREQGLCIHPHLATVTYLSGSGGAPTVVVPAASPLAASDLPAACLGPLRNAHACWPVPGSHLAFDGRLLHGAPAALVATAQDSRRGAKRRRGEQDDGEGGSEAPKAEVPVRDARVTLLVNVWLNHTPAGADPLHEAVVQQLSRAPRVRPVWAHPCVPVKRQLLARRRGFGKSPHPQQPPEKEKWARRKKKQGGGRELRQDLHSWSIAGFGQDVEAEGSLVLRLPASEQWARSERAAAGTFLRLGWDRSAGAELC